MMNVHSASGTRASFVLPFVRVAALFGLASLVWGCVSEEEKRCAGSLKSSQTMLLSMNGVDRSSVEQTLVSLETARGSCQAARMTADVAEIEAAIKNVQGHLAKMNAGTVKEAPKPPSPEQWAEREKNGDERCPRGQSYPHPQKKDVLILCRGPSVVEGGWKQNSQHFAALGFQLMHKGPVLRAQRGKEVLTFHYDAPESDKAPRCVELLTPAGQTWEVAVALATAVDPKTLKKGEPAPAKAGPLPFKVEETGETFKISLGACEAK